MDVVVATAGSLLLTGAAGDAPQPSNKLGSGTTGATAAIGAAAGVVLVEAGVVVLLLTCMPPNMEAPVLVAAVGAAGATGCVTAAVVT